MSSATETTSTFGSLVGFANKARCSIHRSVARRPAAISSAMKIEGQQMISNPRSDNGLINLLVLMAVSLVGNSIIALLNPMKTFNQLLAEQPHIHKAMKACDITQQPFPRDAAAEKREAEAAFLRDYSKHDTIASLRRSAQALEAFIIVKQTVLDEARAALSDLRETLRKLEDR
jgi:hypothetical protein